MKLSNGRYLAAEDGIIQTGWNIAIDHSYQGDALHECYFGKGTSAENVKISLLNLLDNPNPEIQKERENIQKFMAYVDHQIGVEKTLKILKKAAKAMLKVNIAYTEAQTIFGGMISEMVDENYEERNFSRMGWPLKKDQNV